MILEITNEEVQSEVHRDRLSVIMFGRVTCGPCVASKPNFEMASKFFEQNDHHVGFFYVDTDNPDTHPLMEALEIRAVPTFMYYHDGELVGRSDGYHTATQFKDEVYEAMKMVTNNE